jgi:hypothetical protein
MKKLLMGLCFALGLSGCIEDPGARDRAANALLASGFTHITMSSTSPYGECGEGDTSAFSFAATNPTNLRVSGIVCCGYYKRCTVRF